MAHQIANITDKTQVQHMIGLVQNQDLDVAIDLIVLLGHPVRVVRPPKVVPDEKGLGRVLEAIEAADLGHQRQIRVEPELGVNAVVEAAHQIRSLLALQDLERGTTVGPNKITAGSASNVVPDRAVLLVDVRAWTADEQRRLDRGLAALEPVLEGSRLELSGGWNRPPMESGPMSHAVFERAREIGAGHGRSQDGR